MFLLNHQCRHYKFKYQLFVYDACSIRVTMKLQYMIRTHALFSYYQVEVDSHRRTDHVLNYGSGDCHW